MQKVWYLEDIKQGVVKEITWTFNHTTAHIKKEDLLQKSEKSKIAESECLAI